MIKKLRFSPYTFAALVCIVHSTLALAQSTPNTDDFEDPKNGKVQVGVNGVASSHDGMGAEASVVYGRDRMTAGAGNGELEVRAGFVNGAPLTSPMFTFKVGGVFGTNGGDRTNDTEPRHVMALQGDHSAINLTPYLFKINPTPVICSQAGCAPNGVRFRNGTNGYTDLIVTPLYYLTNRRNGMEGFATGTTVLTRQQMTEAITLSAAAELGMTFGQQSDGARQQAVGLYANGSAEVAYQLIPELALTAGVEVTDFLTKSVPKTGGDGGGSNTLGGTAQLGVKGVF